MILFGAIWTVFDYFAYNYYGKYREMSYRSFQVILTVIFAVAVCNFYGWLQACQWLILLLFGVYDFGYYVIELFTGKEERVFWKEFLSYEMTWLWFTPFGWFNKILSPYHLAFESFIGIAIILFINDIIK